MNISITRIQSAAPANIYLSSIGDHTSRNEIRKYQIPMLLQALSDLHFTVPDDTPVICRGEHGKPYLKDYPGFHYNFSDSGCYLLLAACRDREIGADIQRIRTPHGGVLHFAERFFPAEDLTLLKTVSSERTSLFQSSNENSGQSLSDLSSADLSSGGLSSDDFPAAELFTRIWTVREAYLKLHGTGLAGGIGSFSVDLHSGTAGDSVFVELSVPPGYAAAVCWNKI